MTFQGKKNLYVCVNCGQRIITVDRDEGVTPFMIGCREGGGLCPGSAYSTFYTVDQSVTPTHEWYRPDAAEAKKLGRLWRDHLAGGGLKLRKIAEAPRG